MKLLPLFPFSKWNPWPLGQDGAVIVCTSLLILWCFVFGSGKAPSVSERCIPFKLLVSHLCLGPSECLCTCDSLHHSVCRLPNWIFLWRRTGCCVHTIGGSAFHTQNIQLTVTYTHSSYCPWLYLRFTCVPFHVLHVSPFHVLPMSYSLFYLCIHSPVSAFHVLPVSSFHVLPCVQVLTCWAGIPFVYFFSFAFKKGLTAYRIFLLVFQILGLVRFAVEAAACMPCKLSKILSRY